MSMLSGGGAQHKDPTGLTQKRINLGIFVEKVHAVIESLASWDNVPESLASISTHFQWLVLSQLLQLAT